MLTADVRVTDEVNKFVWRKGVRNIPKRIRVRLMRKRNENQESGEKFFTEVRLVKVRSFKGLVTEKTRDN